MRTCVTRRSPTRGSTTWTRARKCPDAARQHYQCSEKTRQQNLGGRWPVPMLRVLLGSTAGTRRNPQHRRSHAGASRVCCGIATEPRGLTASQSRPADILTTAAVPRHSAALDVRVASSIAAAGRGDAAQAAFDRKLTHYRNEIGEYSLPPLLWTAVHPAVTRTLQFATDIASHRNGLHLSTKSLHRRRKHDIQIALVNHGLRSFPKTFSAGRVALRWHHRQSSAPLGTCPRSRRRAWRPRPRRLLRPTQPYLTTTMTLSPWRVTRRNLCSHQLSNCPVYPPCEWE